MACKLLPQRKKKTRRDGVVIFFEEKKPLKCFFEPLTTGDVRWQVVK
jgi:hypothetical protein